ncbi:MAG: AraC family transcriptional regulator [Pseudomonadota bacterium]
MTIDAANIVQLIFAFHAAFFAAFIFSHMKRPVLVLLLAVFSTHMLLNFLAEAMGFSWASHATFAFGFLYGPLLFLFVRELSRSDFALRPVDTLHAVPAAIVMLAPMSISLLRLAAGASILLYFLLIGRDLVRFQSASRNLRTDENTISLRWLAAVIAAFVVLTLVDVLRISLSGRAPLLLQDVAYFGVLAAVFILINIVILRGMRQAAIFKGFSVEDLQASDETAHAPVGVIASAQDKSAFETLTAKIKNDGAFKEPRLTLNDLAARLDTDPRALSRVINIVAQRNFSDFINQIRVEEFKRLLADEQNRQKPLLNLAYDVGFNSKSAFNHSFKKETGMTPTQFRHALADGAPHETK